MEKEEKQPDECEELSQQIPDSELDDINGGYNLRNALFHKGSDSGKINSTVYHGQRIAMSDLLSHSSGSQTPKIKKMDVDSNSSVDL